MIGFVEFIIFFEIYIIVFLGGIFMRSDEVCFLFNDVLKKTKFIKLNMNYYLLNKN